MRDCNGKLSEREAWFMFSTIRFVRVFACAVVLVALLDIAFVAHARPGGGDDYSSGSDNDYSSSSDNDYSSGSDRSSGSDWSSSSDDDSSSAPAVKCPDEQNEDGQRDCWGRTFFVERAKAWLLTGPEEEFADLFGMLWFFGHPALAVVVGVIAELGFGGSSASTRKEWTVGVRSPESTVGAPSPVSRAFRADAVRAIDPDFSIVLFEDFLYSLYAEVQRARGGDRLDQLSAYLSESAIRSLRGRGAVSDVSRVIVGAMRFLDLSGTEPSASTIRIGVQFDANYTETECTTRAYSTRALYVKERWYLSRARAILSRAPGQTNVLACPSCGAPHTAVIAGRCSHCSQTVNNGAFDWTVDTISLERSVSRGPMLGSSVEERGNELPTLFDPDLKQASTALAAKDPQLRWEDFIARVHMIFAEFQVAWTARDLKSMRPFLSDCLFQTQSYWIEAYLQQHLRNVTEGAVILRLELVKISMDRYYDAITVRLWGTGLDYTVNDDNQLISGSKYKERAYTEYWTFIRSSGRTGPSLATKVCSHCGAPLNVNMAGYCEYCKVKISSGAFDWVLSKIEQDDSYRG